MQVKMISLVTKVNSKKIVNYRDYTCHLPSSPPSLMFAPLRPSASVVVSIHLLGRSLTVFAEHEIKGKAVGKTIEAELLQSHISSAAAFL